MTETLIEAAVKQAAGLTNSHARLAATAVIDAIKAGLKSSGKFALKGLGTLSVREVKARDGRNPRTGEPMRLEASKTVRFTAAKALREEIVGQSAPAPQSSNGKQAGSSGQKPATAPPGQNPPARRAKANATPWPAKAPVAAKQPARVATPRHKAAASTPRGGQQNGAGAAQNASSGAG
jgi:DNA-binding protein HU-beta